MQALKENYANQITVPINSNTKINHDRPAHKKYRFFDKGSYNSRQKKIVLERTNFVYNYENYTIIKIQG